MPRWAWIAPLLPIALTALWALNTSPRPGASQSGVEAASTPRLPSASPVAVAAAREEPILAAGKPLALSLPDPIQADSVDAAASVRPVPFGPAPATGPAQKAELPQSEHLPVDPCDAEKIPRIDSNRVAETFFADRGRKVVALSFDDGPSEFNTPRILDILEHYEVRATFFVLGNRAQKLPGVIERIALDGHDVANHSYSHPSFRSLWPIHMRDELCRTNRAIEHATGLRPALFRPPFGRYPPSSVPLIGGLGMNIILWSVDSYDWENSDPATMASAVVRAARPGSVILLHDRESLTVRALPLIIAGLRARGFEIESVSRATGLPAYQPVRAYADPTASANDRANP